MFSNRGGGSFIGFALLFLGIGMLLSTVLTWGWFMIIIALSFIVLGTCLVCGIW